MKIRTLTTLALAGTLALTGCASDEPITPDESAATDAPDTDNAEGRMVKIAFSFPGADHGWLKAITDNATAEAELYDDVEFIPIEGTNDSASQTSQVETLIAQAPDVLIILPHEGDALTPVALAAMQAGIPVVNVDREFATPAAFRTWIGGDNYGIGASAGAFFAEELECSGNVVEIQGLAGISVTELRSQGFADALQARCGDGIQIVAQQPADFAPDKGLTIMETILQAEAQIDAVYTHDDDMAEGVVAAIENAGREGEMFLTGAGGSGAAMDRIAEGGLYRATFLYNPSMAASAVRLARLIALGQGMGDLVEPGVPSRIQLPATTVTIDNVNALRNLGY
jgi:ribose transport system substrate-binding protein